MLSDKIKPGIFKHINCRNCLYPKSDIERFPVADDKCLWSETFADYSPPIYTASVVLRHEWADPDINDEHFRPKWHQVDGTIDRISHTAKYHIMENGCPQNPIGRTGLCGRGLLGRWGPNHAADPIVTRWKRNASGQIIRNPRTELGILQMVIIQRRDNRKWAIPGGMVDPGERVSFTMKREFIEEAIAGTVDKKLIDEFFAHGVEVYKGYVDDYRNTDNAWMETVAHNFHGEENSAADKLKLSAGSDAENVKWTDVDRNLSLYANHIDFVEAVANRLNAHW